MTSLDVSEKLNDEINNRNMLRNNSDLQWKLDNRNEATVLSPHSPNVTNGFLSDTISRSRTLSRSTSSPIDLDDDNSDIHSIHSLESSSSEELEVDSPPSSPLPVRHNLNIRNTSELLGSNETYQTVHKNSEMFSVSALLKKDDERQKPAKLESPPVCDPLEALRRDYPGNYEHAIFQRPFLPPAFPLFAAFAFHQGQQQQSG